MSVAVGDRIAPLLCAPPGSVSMLPNVTIASAVLLSCLEYRPPRNRIVMIEGEFPSVRYVYESLATRLGAEIVTVDEARRLGSSEIKLVGRPAA
jgi:kynureninase